MNEAPDALSIGKRLVDSVLAPMKQMFVGKDEIVDLLGVALVARENLFLLGPPGTAKSALVRELAQRIEGKIFDYLLTRFTEPNEIFGPFDIAKLRDGELVTNTEGMLPEATFVFLDELLNANSAILNSLLMVLNERVFRRGRETRRLPTLMVVGASNGLPEDAALGALFDRFLLRVPCDNVSQEDLSSVLVAGWRLERDDERGEPAISIDEVKQLHYLLAQVDLAPIAKPYVELIHRLRHAGILVSDRRAVKLQRVIAASALLCGRLTANRTDMWVLRNVWDTEEQQSVLRQIIDAEVDKAEMEEFEAAHPQARSRNLPDPERIAADLVRIEEKMESAETADTDSAYLRDQAGVIAARCQWIEDPQQREFSLGASSVYWNDSGNAHD